MRDYSGLNFAQGLLKVSKECTTTRVVTKGCLSHRPCFVFCVIIEPETIANVSRVYAKNGETEAADILIAFGGQYAHPSHIATLPVYFNKGLYIDLETNALSCTVQYLEDV